MRYPASILALLDELERLPGIGPKSAQRIAYWLLTSDYADPQRLADAIVHAKETIHFCPQCFDFAEGDLCEVCSNPQRDPALLCVVAEPRDATAIERTAEYNGLYHVLHGVVSPLDGIGPEQLRVAELMSRLSDTAVTEVIIATNPNVEGETTATYLARLIKPLDIKVTRIASGLPVGGDLEFADEVTLGRAMEARREL
ncbi:MAG: recombination mediator RecR [Coriobacteriia bacterium]|nr:recombination mediator RecR [Coriobacteriia bacterium]